MAADDKRESPRVQRSFVHEILGNECFAKHGRDPSQYPCVIALMHDASANTATGQSTPIR